MTEESRQKFKYLQNEKSLQDKIKSIFHHFKSTLNDANKTNFLGRWEFDFKCYSFLLKIFGENSNFNELNFLISLCIGAQYFELAWINFQMQLLKISQYSQENTCVGVSL